MMKRIKFWKSGHGAIKAWIAFVGAFLFFSCNETFTRQLTDDYGESGTSYEKGRILMIEMDGVNGEAVLQAYNEGKIPNIKLLTGNSVYSFDGLADSKSNLDSISCERGWANLFTGVTSHGIGEAGKPIEELAVPSLLTLMKKALPKMHTALYASNTSFYSTFAKDADVHMQGEDGLVKDAVVSALTLEDSLCAQVVVAQFNSVELAGKNAGFQDETGKVTDEVLDALQRLDGYVGEIMNTLRERKHYTEENWLVIITSNYGGNYGREAVADYYDAPDRNAFVMMYNSRFASKRLLQPTSGELKYTYYTPVYDMVGKNATLKATVVDTSLFNILPGTSATIQFLTYDGHKDPWGFQVMLSKRSGREVHPGWQISTHYSGYAFESSNSNPRWNETAWLKRRDFKWHSVTLVIDGKANTFQMYIDGVPDSKAKGTWKSGDVNDYDEPLTIGYIDASSYNNQLLFSLTNLQFYDVALPQDFIAKNHCRTRLHLLGSNYEYWDHLIGYWPCDLVEDFKQDRLRDYSKYAAERNGGSDMVFSGGKAVWTNGMKVEENICPEPEVSYYRDVFNTVDVAYQALLWLGITIDSDWQLEGNGWSFEYSYQNN